MNLNPDDALVLTLLVVASTLAVLLILLAVVVITGQQASVGALAGLGGGLCAVVGVVAPLVARRQRRNGENGA